MNRKDFDCLTRAIVVAKHMRKNEAYIAGICVATVAIADAIAAENANFDREKFLKRCGVV